MKGYDKRDMGNPGVYASIYKQASEAAGGNKDKIDRIMRIIHKRYDLEEYDPNYRP